MTCSACGGGHAFNPDAPGAACCAGMERQAIERGDALAAVVWRARASSMALRARLARLAGYDATEMRMAEDIRAGLYASREASGMPQVPRTTAVDHPENLAAARWCLANSATVEHYLSTRRI